jgi:hypothetical protein
VARRSIGQFFVLVVVLTVPFWLLSAATGLMLAPGAPVAALAFVCPVTAAVILVYRDEQGAGVVALLKRSIEVTSKRWLAPALLLLPAVLTLSFWVLRLGGGPVPVPEIAVLPTVLLCAVAFVGALGEELGWSGYATDPMQARWGALRAGILLGAFGTVYHYVPLAQAHRSVAWVAWWSLNSVAWRVIIVWLYDNSGHSVLVAALFHATINVTWQLFPVNGSYYDPRVTGVITALVAVIVTAFWGPTTLARYRFGRQGFSQVKTPSLAGPVGGDP